MIYLKSDDFGGNSSSFMAPNILSVVIRMATIQASFENSFGANENQ